MSSLYRECDAPTLERLHRVLREMLDDFIALCDKHGIRWWAEFGAAIGALRHGGMVPWDDDIDIGMLREDYDKFLAVAEAEMGDKHYVLDAEWVPAYPMMTARWCLRGTTFREEAMAGIDAPFGIFLDLHCFDRLADDEREARRQRGHTWFWGKLMALRAVRFPVLHLRGVRAVLVRAACFIGRYALRCLATRNCLFRQVRRWARAFENRETARVFCPFEPVPFRSGIRVDEIFPTVDVPFDGRAVRVQRGADASLRKNYGDYMTPPPPEERHHHPPAELDFGGYGAEGRPCR